jgi:hypothetical protein
MTIRAKYDSLEVTPRPILVMPQGAKKSQRGAKSSQGLGAIARKAHRTNHHNFRSPAVCERLEASSKVKPIERRSRSAYCFVIERRSRSQGPVPRYCGCERSNGGVGRQDRTEEPVGNQGQGIAIGRTSRSAIKGELDGSNARFLLPIERKRRSAFCCDKVEREKLGGCASSRRPIGEVRRRLIDSKST